MWKWQIFVKAEEEAGRGKRVPLLLPLWPFLSNIENLNVVQFFVKYMTKTYCSTNQHLQRNLFKSLWFTIRANPPTLSIQK